MEKCTAIIEVADDYGDNHATFTCELQKGHDGAHRETYIKAGGVVTLTFDDSSADAK
jgi:hypothetical protein